MYFAAQHAIGNQRQLGKHEAHIIGSITVGILYSDSNATQLIDVRKLHSPLNNPEYWEAVYKTKDGVYVYKRYIIHNDTVAVMQL
jgi:hypothetical protein